VSRQPDSGSGANSADGVGVLRVIIALNLISTSVHYTHNFVMANCYPAVFPFVDATAYKIGIGVFWPLLTVMGLQGYRLYKAGETQRPRRLLAAYSLLGITTIGHFLGGNPKIPPFFYATLFTDFLGGSALLAFVAWTFRRPDTGLARKG
jgi:hypothetical protein